MCNGATKVTGLPIGTGSAIDAEAPSGKESEVLPRQLLDLGQKLPAVRESKSRADQLLADTRKKYVHQTQMELPV